MHEYVLSCFSERVLSRERACRKRLLGLGVLLSVNASCRVFRTRLVKGAGLSKASSRSWRLVKYECVLLCFSRERARLKRLEGLGILVACYECLYAPLHSRQSAEYSLIMYNASP